MALIPTKMEFENNTYQEEFDIEQLECIQWPWFERIYFFVMLIYAAQMTPETARMIQNLSGNPIPFVIPIILTIILLVRNPISFLNKKLGILIGITGLWTVASLIKYNTNTTEELSYHFFLYYAIIIAFIHIKIFDIDLMNLYEKTMVLMCKITLPLWLVCVIAPSIVNPIFDAFPETIFGHNFLYIFNKINADVYEEGYLFLRNAGFSWEPGRYAVMLCFAILFNIQRNGVTIKENNSILWLLAALISTESTTGYSIAIVLWGIHLIKEWSFKNTILASIVFIPIAMRIFQLDFMFGKINSQFEVLNSLDTLIKNTGKYSDGSVALDRFPSFVIEFGNFMADPLLGYSRNFEHSAIFNLLTDNIRLTGGFMQIFSQFGIFLAVFFYGILIYSSIKVGKYFGTSNAGLAVCTLLCLISYPLFIIPLFFAFWLQGFFWNEEDGDYENYESVGFNYDEK